MICCRIIFRSRTSCKVKGKPLSFLPISELGGMKWKYQVGSKQTFHSQWWSFQQEVMFLSIHILKNYSSWKGNQSGAFKLWCWKSLNRKLRSRLELWKILTVRLPCFYTPLGSRLTTGEGMLAQVSLQSDKIHRLPLGLISMYVT